MSAGIRERPVAETLSIVGMGTGRWYWLVLARLGGALRGEEGPRLALVHQCIERGHACRWHYTGLTSHQPNRSAYATAPDGCRFIFSDNSRLPPSFETLHDLTVNSQRS